MLIRRWEAIGGTHSVWCHSFVRSSGTEETLGEKVRAWFEMETVTAEKRVVDGRGRGPTVLLCVAVVLSAVLVVVAKPLAAAAASTLARSHAHGIVARAARHAADATMAAPAIQTSPNWSGYVVSDEGQSFTQVSAKWTQPSVVCSTKNAWTLFWVGFDGWPSGESTANRSVEQGGTSAQCTNGVPQYSAFYEMWPSEAVQPIFSIDAGDQMEASVVYLPGPNGTQGMFQINVTDETSGQTATRLASCDTAAGLVCPRISAEWVAESPSRFGTKTWFPLADYGTVNFQDAMATDFYGRTGPITSSNWLASGIERVDGLNKPLAEVSGLVTSGSASAFSDTWKRR
jgi:hypothetical protein